MTSQVFFQTKFIRPSLNSNLRPYELGVSTLPLCYAAVKLEPFGTIILFVQRIILKLTYINLNVSLNLMLVIFNQFIAQLKNHF